MGRLQRLMDEPVPLRFLALRFLDRRFNFLGYPSKLNLGVIERPHYGHCLLKAAELARKLGQSRITAIEFGVAGGNGLLSLERHAELVRKETGVGINIYGFDSGTGMPPPRDYRDMPYMWQQGYFAMESDKLRARLHAARLVLGPVEQTVRDFCSQENPPPIGFIAFDLDYYSSTASALALFDADSRHFLPRVACYFDDVVGDIDWAYNEFTGELLAINDFNRSHEDVKLARVNGLRFVGGRLPRAWHEQIFVAHFFRHADYGRPISEVSQHPLDPAAGRERLLGAEV
jgi:hypothetical protein